jgi:diadenosine tetraphosphate (Ap4A) HIT family hydrolase
MNTSSYRLWNNEHFAIEQCRDCAIPGYLIVSPLKPVVHLEELSGKAAALLGPTLVLAVSVVRAVIQPERVYCAQFGEEATQLHFHVFPRTVEVTVEYLRALPEQADMIRGPVLLDWARTRYKSEKLLSKAIGLIERIRIALDRPA